MPNWCYNTMTVKGDPSELAEFKAAITTCELSESSEFSLTALIPMPEALHGSTSPAPESPEPHENWANLLANGEITQEWYDELCADRIKQYETGQRLMAECGYPSWYEWQDANWGIKWGDCDSTIEADHSDVFIGSYDTPWSPFRESFFETISARFPNLKFTIGFREEGMGFVGAYSFANGETLSVVTHSTPVFHGDWDNPDDCSAHMTSMKMALTSAMAEVWAG